ncbi:MAG: hypothetical protein O2905_07120 [Proteobacteria bacterium]|nr:hypothetical protein [Pseudomonadota bacterium]
MRGVALAVVLAGSLSWAPAGAQDDIDFLPEGEGREDVFYICQACHSLMIVKQQRLSYTRWDKLLHWMEEEQGLPELPGDVRERVLGYLSTALGEDAPR